MSHCLFCFLPEFGGEVAIGRPESKKIEAELFVSFSFTNVKDTYFYAQVNKMTFQDILGLFQLPTPDVLKETGFPNGFTIGFTLNPDGELLFFHLGSFEEFLSGDLSIHPFIHSFIHPSIKINVVFFAKSVTKDGI